MTGHEEKSIYLRPARRKRTAKSGTRDPLCKIRTAKRSCARCAAFLCALPRRRRSETTRDRNERGVEPFMVLRRDVDIRGRDHGRNAGRDTVLPKHEDKNKADQGERNKENNRRW